MATIKKTVTKKALTKPAAKKVVATKVIAKKTAPVKKTVAKKVTEEKPQIKKGSRLACQVCGFAITVDRACGCMEMAPLVCCKTPMKLRRPRPKK